MIWKLIVNLIATSTHNSSISSPQATIANPNTPTTTDVQVRVQKSKSYAGYCNVISPHIARSQDNGKNGELYPPKD